jgi:hypothetical protein
LILKYTNLGIRFLLELCVLVALGYWGFHTDKGVIVKIGLAIGTPLLAAIVWGTFASPNAPMQLSEPLRLILELVIFGAAAAALYAAGHPALCAFFVLIAVMNRFLMYVWGQ